MIETAAKNAPFKTILASGIGRERTRAVAEAVRFLSEREAVALPTETVYGLAADATEPDAILKIFEAKERPFFDPLIVHLPDKEWLAQLTQIPAADLPLVERLTARFWPGPLTLVLPRSEAVPDLVASGLPTVAVRQSAHPVFEAVVRAFGRPLAAPSANRFGRISPTTAAHVMNELEGRIPFVVDGGECPHGVESTIVAVAGGRLEVLRNGPITREELAAFAPVTEPGELVKPVAPGQLKSHYAPRTPMFLLKEGEAIRPGTPEQLGLASGKRCGALAWRGIEAGAGERYTHTEILSPEGNLREAAARLFAAMRRLDAARLDAIIAEPVPETGLGVAIMDRLRKASYGSHHPLSHE